MRSNKAETRRIRQAMKKLSPGIQKAMSILSLGIDGRQWIAWALIGIMLLPTFSLPAPAGYSENDMPSQFQPVDEELPGWTELWKNLNEKIESWRTSSPAADVSYGDDDDKKPKKETKTAVTGEKTIAENSDILVDTVDPTKKDSKAGKEILKSAVAAAKKAKAKTPSTALVVNQLPGDERESVYNSENNLGSPPGQTEMDSPNQPAALRIRHRAGTANFNSGGFF